MAKCVKYSNILWSFTSSVWIKEHLNNDNSISGKKHYVMSDDPVPLHLARGLFYKRGLSWIAAQQSNHKL